MPFWGLISSFLINFFAPSGGGHWAIQGPFMIEGPSHLASLDRHAALLIACGAKLHDDASDLGRGFYIVELDIRKQAQAFIEGDPFYQAGLFLNVQITRWRKSYVLGKNLLTE